MGEKVAAGDGEDGGGAARRDNVAPRAREAHALFVGLVLPTSFAALAAWSHLPSLLFVLPLLVLSVLAARWLFAAWTRPRERTMREVVTALTAAFAARSRSGLRVAAPIEDGAHIDSEQEGEAEAEAASSEMPALRLGRPHDGLDGA